MTIYLTYLNYSVFVQNHFASVKANNPGKSHGYIMQELSRKYKEENLSVPEEEEDISSLVIDISSISLS